LNGAPPDASSTFSHWQ